MLGKIIEVNNKTIKIKLNIILDEIDNLVDRYVMIEDDDKKIVGKITNMNLEEAQIELIGQLVKNKFVYGLILKPSFKSSIKVISNEKIDYIIGIEHYNEKQHLYLGTSPIYEDVKVGVKIDDFFSNHFAIFGNTGSGKSCSLARILQNLLAKEEYIPYKSNIFIFDAYGEYSNAFSNINSKSLDISFKQYTTNLKSKKNLLNIPPWLLKVDDLALLLNVNNINQIPVIETSLKLVTIFASEENKVTKQKNNIIARTILDILSSGKEAGQIRDQIFSVLTYYHTSELNLDTEIYQPGYTRALKQCFIIDSTGKIREMEMLINFFSSFITDDLEMKLPDGSFKYTLQDLKEALDFALISEGSLKSEKVYDEYNNLKIRLDNLLNSEYKAYFDCDKYLTKEQFICDLLVTSDKKKAQIVNFDINYVDDRFAKTIVKIYSRILFDYAKNLKNRASFPIHLILEEAHRYIQNDNDINIIGYNIFERIAKEGRKYATILGVVSQRPMELSETVLSQCSNFLIFKMFHPKDLEYIKEILPNLTETEYEKFKTLPPGICIAFGNAFKMSSFIKFDMPYPIPSSSNAKISDIWFLEKV